jgi:superoxide dismutase
MAFKFIQNFIIEGKKDKLFHLRLSYDRNELEPAVSEKTIDYHYGTLYKAYVDRYNKGEGDDDFNEAGAGISDGKELAGSISFRSLAMRRSR